MRESGAFYSARSGRENAAGTDGRYDRKNMKKRKLVALLVCCALLCGCGQAAPEETAPATEDPHAGMVQVDSSYGLKMWIKAYPELPVNDLRAEDFEDGAYIGDAYAVRWGIDVSEHQGEIDWAAVKESGVEFAILRAGYRGYGEKGLLHEDQYFDENMAGVMAQGLDLGVYFFSQARDTEEAREEAEFLLHVLENYPVERVNLPVFFDWEYIDQEEARTDGMNGTAVTACADAFCRRVAEAGYAPGVYAYRHLGYFTYNLPVLKDYTFWIAALGDYPDFYYAHEFWQYSIEGEVPGIGTNVDLDAWFIPVEKTDS